jgi:hypothetical protein
MQILIQHNVNAGLGDYTNSIYRYFHLVEKIKENGFTNIGLYINMKRSTMFNKDFFFKLYNRIQFENIFDNIIISETPITNNEYENLSFFYINGEKETSINQFDVFINESDILFQFFKKNLHLFFNNSKLRYRNFFSDYVMEKYKKMNLNKDEEYISLHFRAKDSQDNVDLYIDHEDEFKNLIFEKGKIFICSNSYKFKQYIKSFNSPNVFMYDLPYEKEHGNHLSALPFNGQFGLDEYQEKTIYAAIETLTISDSKEVFSFNYFGNVHSNFLNAAKYKGVKINITALKNGMNWKP